MSNNATSNEADLDWLVRNVHKWPCGKHQPWCYVVTKIDGERTWASNVLSSSFPYSRVDKDQWLARRAELQNKPGWEGAPEWAELLAQDDSGEWYWYAAKPAHPGMKSWWPAPGAKNAQCGKGEVLGDWRDTLEKRPEQAEFEPFVSVEDERQVLSELEMLAKVSHLISDKRHRITTNKYTKTIHGVPVDVYDVLQAWGVINPALQHLIKKALQCGQRGHKDNAQDLQDIIDSAIRAKELG